MTANPLGRLRDGVPGNEVSLRKVRVGGVPGARTVMVPPYEGIDTEVFSQGF